jgi:MutS domain I
MTDRQEDLIPVVQRSYDLCAGLYEHVNRFPRAQRTLLGRVILEDALQMLTLLTVVNRRTVKHEGLAEASGRLDALRITLRLSKRLGFLSNGGYERLSQVADEVGRMLGGWLKHEAPAERDPSPAPPAVVRPPVRRRGGVRFMMTSPTIEKYLRVKLAHPEAVVFVRVGSFCQTFFEDAAFCHRELRLAVRDLAADSEPEKIPSCGFPLRVLDKYVAWLQQRGRQTHVE